MQAAIFSPQWYTDEVYFKKEKTELFEKVWIYAGLKNSIKNPNEYFTLDLFGLNIVIHNLAGKIEAYLNVCPHRGGPLVLGSNGSGAPVCKYHGWSFRDGADLTGVSNLSWFNTDESKGSCRRELKKYGVEIVGPVIFVFLGDNPIDLEDQYSDEVLSKLRSYGDVGPSIVSDFSSPLNWKLNMENVKDFLHPYYVHAESFKPLLGYEDKPVERIIKDSQALPRRNKKVELKELSFVQHGDLNIPFDKQWWAAYVEKTQPDNCYQNMFLFPNTNFCSVSGGHYVIQQYLPVSPNQFTYRLTVALPKVVEKFEYKNLLCALLKIERDVIKEDDLVLVKLQENMSSMLPNEYYTHGDYEVPIMDQMQYLKDTVYVD